MGGKASIDISESTHQINSHKFICIPKLLIKLWHLKFSIFGTFSFLFLFGRLAW